jgi:recombination associated protein RdgC
MFKQVSIFKISRVSPNHPDEDFKKSAFVPCGPTQEQSTGWVPPRGHEHGALVGRVVGAPHFTALPSISQ